MSASRRPIRSPGVDLEPRLARVLRFGTYASIGLMAVGVVLLVAGGASPLDPGPPINVPTLLSDAAAGMPGALIWLGILGIMGTPGLVVAGALLGFARRGERPMVAVAALVLGVVLLGVIAGLVTG